MPKPRLQDNRRKSKRLRKLVASLKDEHTEEFTEVKEMKKRKIKSKRDILKSILEL